MRTRFAVVGLAALLLGGCTPPPGWKNKSYIYSSASARGGSQRTIRVKIHTGKPIALTSRGRYSFRGRATAATSGRGKFTPRGSGEHVSRDGVFKMAGREYSGYVRIHKQKGSYIYVNILPIDEYLVSVVGHEMNPTWNAEALKAQAVVARTYALQRMNDNARRPYDVDATTRHQVYRGRLRNEGKLRAAVGATRNEVITYDSKLANVFFYSSCGGRTAEASEVWKTAYPYLRSKSSGYCKLAPVYKWETKVSAATMAGLLGKKKVTRMKVTRRTASKRVKSLQIATNEGALVISGKDFRRKLGAKRLKSTMFGIRKKGSNFYIAGRGFGHGVGLCQWGARFMGQRGKKYRRILSHFFPRTRVGSMRSGLLS